MVSSPPVNRRTPRAFAAALIALQVSLLTGCSLFSSRPAEPPAAIPSPARSHPGDVVSRVAVSMIGVPYRYGGASPAGFDCSGLVWFAHRQAGVPVPRTAREQDQVSADVAPTALQPGDLLFFDTTWRSGHVGIYVGGGDFVHAPSSGKRVMRSTIREGYFAKRLRRAGRVIAR